MLQLTPRNRSGLTLIELLMVIMILVTVTAAAVPMLAPGIESRKIREGSRSVSTMLAKARSEAIAKNRPVGVFFASTLGVSGSDASDTLFQVEAQVPYCGDVLNATVRLSRIDANTLTAQFGTGADAGFAPVDIPTGIVRPNDTIQLNLQGPLYKIVDDTPDSNGFVTGNDIELELISGVVDLPWPYTPQLSAAVAYKINRQPIKSAVTPTALPTGIIVDVVHSGVGDFVFPIRPITIMFAPNGSPYLQNADGSTTRLLQSLYLLVGRSEGLMSASDHTNLQSLDSQWVAVGAQNGQAVVSENAAVDPVVSVEIQIATARQFARDMRGMGGK